MKAQRKQAVQTLVHVSARASAAADLNYAEKARNILAWETQTQIPIYPPPQLPLSPSPEIPSHAQKDESWFVSPYIRPAYSPSQIPDSQPRTPFGTSPLVLDVIPNSPLQGGQRQGQSPEEGQSGGSQGGKASTTENRQIPMIVNQSAHRPLPAASFESPPLSPRAQFPPPPDSQALLSHRPLFTSTPKSKPLKSLLSKNEKHEISYPMPKVDDNRTPLVTRPLSTLFPLTVFRCASQSRDLEDWERGFWRVDLSSWPEHEKLEFWTKLRKAIESGRFGWIYILFDAFDDDILNVFCFGGAAKHVWVFLYVMSGKRTKHGLQYLDAGGNVVIEGTR